MRILLLATLAALSLTALPLDVAPTAEAAPCIPEVNCKVCVFSYTNEPGCIVPNPCDPRFCDVWIIDPTPFLP